MHDTRAHRSSQSALPLAPALRAGVKPAILDKPLEISRLRAFFRKVQRGMPHHRGCGCNLSRTLEAMHAQLEERVVSLSHLYVEMPAALSMYPCHVLRSRSRHLEVIDLHCTLANAKLLLQLRNGARPLLGC